MKTILEVPLIIDKIDGTDNTVCVRDGVKCSQLMRPNGATLIFGKRHSIELRLGKGKLKTD